MEALVGASMSVSCDAMARATHMLLDAREAGARVYVMGNGGSASTATHFVCDLIKTAQVSGRRPLRAFSLSDNPALLTAWGNDVSYEIVFAEQVRALADPGDVVIAISATGKSPNIVAGLEAAKAAGARTIGLLGFDGGPSLKMVDVAVHVSSHDYGIVESVHLGIVHAVTASIRGELEGTDVGSDSLSCVSSSTNALLAP